MTVLGASAFQVHGGRGTGTPDAALASGAVKGIRGAVKGIRGAGGKVAATETLGYDGAATAPETTT